MFLLCAPFTCASFYSLGYIFLVRTPEYWCKVPEMATNALNLTQGALMNLTTGQDDLMNLTIPWNQGSDVQRGLDQCYTYNRNYSSLTAEHLVYGTNQNLTTTPCQQWEFSTSDVTSSLVTQVKSYIISGTRISWQRCQHINIYLYHSCLPSTNQRPRKV